MISDRFYNFSVIFHPEEEGGYSVFVPSLPGCVTQGETLDEARKMAQEAIELYCESLLADGLPVPHNQGEFVGQIAVYPQLA